MLIFLQIHVDCGGLRWNVEFALRRLSAERLNGFSGDTHGDKESINPSHHARPSFGTFMILMIFLRCGGVALVFPRVFLGRGSFCERR